MKDEAGKSESRNPKSVEEWREQVPQCTVLEGDCRKLLWDIPDGAIDLVVCDIPYGLNYQSNRRKSGPTEQISGDQSWAQVLGMLNDASRKVARVLRDDGYVYLFCAPLHVPQLVPFITDSSGLIFRRMIAWVKGRGMGATDGSHYVGAWEAILMFSKGKPRSLNGHPSDAIWVGRTTKNDLHPTQKDLMGLTTVIEASSAPGEIVLDFCAGSGSTGAACDTGCDEPRRSILMEINPENYQKAVTRMRRLGPVAEKFKS